MAIPVGLPSSAPRSAVTTKLRGNGQDASKALASHIAAARDVSEDSSKLGSGLRLSLEDVEIGQVGQNAQGYKDKRKRK